MASSYLTPTIITRKALMILHQKLSFISNINRQYDARFAASGASVSGKIGPSLQIRLPNQYTVRTGLTMQEQDVTESEVTLTVSTVKGVDMNFDSVDLALTIDDFTERYIDPAMAILASSIEADALSMVLDIYNSTGTPATIPAALLPFTNARAKMAQCLTPIDGNWRMLVDSNTQAAMVEGLKSLFHSGDTITKGFKEGYIGNNIAGFRNWYENNLLPALTPGTLLNSDTPLTNDATPQSGATLAINWTSHSGATLTVGQTFTIDGVYMVHPETKVAYNFLQQFVVTDVSSLGSSSGGTIGISPAIVASGAKQNVSAKAANDKAITLTNLSLGAVSRVQNIGFHKDAFTFVTADLPIPKGQDIAARVVKDGISMSLIRGFDIVNRKFPCRIDVLYGYKTIRPQMACRVTC